MAVERTPSIAVIVPNRNDARFLPRCLRSVIEQEVAPEELIIVDDQSTDDSVTLIRSLIAGNPRAQLIVNPVNLGTNGAMEMGLRHARSDCALFLSANDFVLPGIFARAKLQLARSPDAGLWSALAWLVDEEDQTIRLHPSAVIALNDAVFSPAECVRLAHRFGNWFNGTTLIYRLDALNAVGGFDPGFGALADLFAALNVASLRGAAYSPEPFAAIRRHSGSFSHRSFTNVAALESTLKRFSDLGAKRSPGLFIGDFTERTALRFRFAAIRASGGTVIAEVAGRVRGWRHAALIMLDRLLPSSLRIIRVAFAFLILRPFDILPTLWYRVIGWIIVRARLRLRGETPP
jgi:glycosyltransferase involved in cell wall biosynthesis